MTRVATCEGCGAKYKVPATVKATRTKCKKCGGVVPIPPVGAAAGAAAGAAPEPAPAKAPTKAKSPGRPATGAGPTRTSGSKGPGAKAAGRDKPPAGPSRGGRRGAAGKAGAKTAARSRAGKGGRGAKDADGKKLGTGALLGAIGLAVLLLGGGAWFVFGGDDAPADTTTTTDSGASSDGATDTDAATAVTAASAAGPVVIPPDEAAPAAAEPDPSDEAAAAPAALATEAPKPESNEPRDPVLDFFDLFGPITDLTDEEFADQTDMVVRCFLDPPPPKSQRKLQAQLEEFDIVDLTPSIINAFHGIDVSDPITIRDSYKLVEWWQERCARKPHFFYDGDVGRTAQEDIDKRVIVLEGIVKWWQAKLDSPDALDDYRETVALALATKQPEEG